jgi:ATP-dependent protease HslVU (ClpYQ) peptidase subunit
LTTDLKEALATMRCYKPDIQFFERKLNEIDLVESATNLEKLHTLSEIGLEVTLNSSEGTQILVNQISWFLREGYGDVVENRTILDVISGILWTWSVQAVEYQRNLKTVAMIINSLKTIFKLSLKANAANAVKNCKKALESMKHQANEDKLEEIYSHLQSVRLTSE